MNIKGINKLVYEVCKQYYRDNCPRISQKDIRVWAQVLLELKSTMPDILKSINEGGSYD